jgi:4-aminobutyrate aminotransferase-like enzyme
MSGSDVVLAAKEFLFPAVFHYYDEPLVIDRAKDQYVWDSDGRQYLDFFAGIVTVSVGHVNDYVTGRVHEQLDRLQHVSTLFATEPQVVLASKIASIAAAGAMPGSRPAKSFFTNSGTEANETAIVLARHYTGNQEIVALRHSYHGRSALAMGLTGNSAWKIAAPQPGIVHAHNAYCYRCPFGMSYPDCGIRCATDVEELIRTTTSGTVAGVIAEPIQGVGGFITPPKEYFGIVADIVRRYGGIFISDEVQTGWGRTGGRWFGIEQYGVTADIITGAKGLGNGLPIGVTTARAEVADSLRGLSISTFGGNPVTNTAASAVLEYIEENALPSNCEIVGAHLRQRLLELADHHALIGDVRGMGLLQGVELVTDRRTKEPATGATARAMEAARRNGLLIGKGGLYGNTLRISPPMNISKSDVDEFARLLDRSLADVTAGS